jgi:hypothetical protein
MRKSAKFPREIRQVTKNLCFFTRDERKTSSQTSSHRAAVAGGTLRRRHELSFERSDRFTRHRPIQRVPR